MLPNERHGKGPAEGLSRKPRSNAKLKTQPEELQLRIVEYGRKHSLVATVKWLRQQGIRVTDMTVSRFLGWHRAKEEFARKESVVLGMLEAMKKRDPSLTPEKVRETGQTYFSALALEGKDARVWSLVQHIALRQEKLELDWKKYRDAVKARKAALERELNEVKSAGGISPDTLGKIEAELKLL